MTDRCADQDVAPRWCRGTRRPRSGLTLLIQSDAGKKGDHRALDASELPGSPQLAGTTVTPPGFGKDADKAKAECAADSATLKLGAYASLALTDGELGSITLKRGMASIKLTEVRARSAMRGLFGRSGRRCGEPYADRVVRERRHVAVEGPEAGERSAERLIRALGGHS